MIRRFWYKYKQIVVGLILVLLIGGLIYIGVTTQNNQKETEIEKLVQDTFPGVAMGTAVKMTIYSESNERNEQINQVLEEDLAQLEQEISVQISDSDVYICNNFYKVNHPFCERFCKSGKREQLLLLKEICPHEFRWSFFLLYILS